MADTSETKDAKTEEGDEGTKRVIYSHPLIRNTDMTNEMRNETAELCITACEKHPTNNENAARFVKENLDKKYGPSWHVVIGESYGIEITHELNSLLYMYFAANLAICVWKCI